MQWLYVIAEHLHMRVIDVMEMPLAEFTGWQVYLARKAEKLRGAPARRAG